MEFDSEIVDGVGAALSQLEDINSLCTTSITGYFPCLVVESHTGRPRFDIRKEQSEHLLNIRFILPI